MGWYIGIGDRNESILLEMSYFRLWLVRHYYKSHWKLFFLARGTSMKDLWEYLLVVVSSAMVRSMSEILSKLTTFFPFFQFANFLKCLFNFSLSKYFLIWGLNLKKLFSDIWFYENVFHIYSFFSDWTILCYKSSLNRGVWWTANSSL